MKTTKTSVNINQLMAIQQHQLNVTSGNRCLLSKYINH